MKVCFISNYFNHHQMDFCDEMFSILGNDFCFIQTKNIPEFRKNLGYLDFSQGRDYILFLSDSPERVKNKIEESDILINTQLLGNQFIKEAQRGEKIIFWYMERLFKEKNPIYFLPKYFRAHLWLCYKKNSNQKFLCASSFCKKDLALISKKLSDNSYKWGYFPHIDYSKKHIFHHDGIIRYLFVGRLIDWKHPEICLLLAKHLKARKIRFKITIIGEGPLYKKIENEIKKNNLTNEVFQIGSVKTDVISDFYCESDFFLFPSNRREGWGAVLNEAMGYGCIPIASGRAGSTHYLMSECFSEFIYYSKKELHQIINKTIDLYNSQLRFQLSSKAVQIIKKEWNGQNAANSFVCECKSILNNGKLFVNGEGIMSKA